ncbi:unnamed protein product [Parajaminaea phylloscopi]
MAKPPQPSSTTATGSSALRLSLTFGVAHPTVPPLRHWPTADRPSEHSDDADSQEASDDDSCDEWASETSASTSRRRPRAAWVTALAAWQQVGHDGSAPSPDRAPVPQRGRSNSSSSPPAHAPLGAPVAASPAAPRARTGGAASRVAVATADGCVWLFAPPSPEATAKPSVGTAPDTPTDNADGTGIVASSSHSSLSQHRDSHIHHPPFVGFHAAARSGLSSPDASHHQHNESITSLSPTAATATAPASVSPTASRFHPTSPAQRQHDHDALESRLEAQWHSGSGPGQRDSVVGGVMEALGLARHNRSHPASHAHTPQPGSGHHTPARRGPSASASASATAAAGETSPPSHHSPVQMSRASSQTAHATSSGPSRRQHHARAVTVLTGAPDSASALPIPGQSASHPTLPSDTQGASASIPMLPEEHLTELQPVGVVSGSTRDPSPVISMATCATGIDAAPAVDDTLLLLHRGGLLTAWSLTDGIVMAECDLAAIPVMPREALHEASATESVKPTSGLLGGNGGFVATTLAAIRSHTNSPAIGSTAKGHTPGQPMSGPAPKSDPSTVTAAGPVRREGARFEQLELLRTGHSALLACYDAQRDVVFVIQASATTLTVIDTVYVPMGGSRDCPSLRLTASLGGRAKVWTTRLSKDRRSCDLHTTEIHTSGASPQDRVSARGVDRFTHWHKALPTSQSVRGCVALDDRHLLFWTADQVLLGSFAGSQDSAVATIASLPMEGLQGVSLLPPSIGGQAIAVVQCVASHPSTTCGASHKIVITLGADPRQSSMSSSSLLPIAPGSVSSFSTIHQTDEVVTAIVSEGSLELKRSIPGNETGDDVSLDLYQTPATRPSDATSGSIKGIFAMSMERIAVVLSTGHVTLCTLTELLSGSLPAPPAQNPPCVAASSVDASVALLRMVTNPRQPGTKHLVAGFSSGDIAVWDPSTLRLQAEWSLFTTPITDLAVFGDSDNTLQLYGCMALSAQDGSLAVLTFDGLKVLYLIPGRGLEAPLKKIAVRVDDLMQIFGDGRARVWNIRTQELRRSVGEEQAMGMLEDGAGAWSQHSLSGDAVAVAGVKSSGVLSQNHFRLRPMGTESLAADFHRAIDVAAKAVTNAVDAQSQGPRDDDSEARKHAATLPATKPKAVRPALASAVRDSKDPSRLEEKQPRVARAYQILRPLLMSVWPRGVSTHHDARLASLFSPPLVWPESGHNTASLGTSVVDSRSTDVNSSERQLLDAGLTAGSSLRLGTELTASVLLACLAILNILARAETVKADSGQGDASLQAAIDWTLLSLPDQVRGFQPPDLPLLSVHLIDPTPDIHKAARRIFGWRLGHASTQEIDRLCQEWKDKLPGQPVKAEPVQSAGVASNAAKEYQALLFLGFTSIHLFTSQDPALLRDVARAIFDVIHNEASYSALADSAAALSSSSSLLAAIHLCLEGFGIWQNYIDAMDLLRSLFVLAMQPDDHVRSVGLEAVRAYARKSVIKIAEENTPLFMTTLHLDMLQAASPTTGSDSTSRSGDASASRLPTVMTSASSTASPAATSASTTMRVVAFMARRRRQLLFPNLPRLAEAVVKALDPTQPASHREALLPAATAMIGELVSAYGTICFHRTLQRLAIGTHEGAVVLYDLRSATRLFVLEGGHTGHSLDAISFSPDGRRLVSVSHCEGRMLGWKVGSSVAGWFKPGVMPRQGGEEEREGAYKCLRFTRSSQHSSGAAQQSPWRFGEDKVLFEWKDDRTVKVDIVEDKDGGDARTAVSVFFDVA